MRIVSATTAAAGIAVLALAGCQSGAASGGAAPIAGLSMLPTSVPSGGSEQAQGDEEGEGDEQADDDALVAACDVDTIAGVQDVVAQQLAAFTTRDFEAAFELASAQFRSFSTAESLRTLIMDGRHEEVADSASHEFTECRQPEPGRADAAVSVTGRNGRTVLLVYTFVREDGEWRILQSAPMDGPDSEAGSATESGQPA